MSASSTIEIGSIFLPYGFSAAVIMGYVTHEFLDVFDNVFNINTLVGIFLQGLFSGLLGIAAGIIVLILLKNEELRDVWRTLHHKIWKAKVLGVDASSSSPIQ